MFTGKNIYQFHIPTHRKTMFLHKQMKYSTNHTIAVYLKENCCVLIQPLYSVRIGP